VLHADVEVDRRDFPVRAVLEVADGERVALFGPSGAGKTTVLEAVAGLVAPRHGRVELAGRVLTSTVPPVTVVPPWRRRVGLLRQDPGLFPHLTVRANLLYARPVRRLARQSARPRGSSPGDELDSLARLLGIEGLLDAMPARLSGGQRHRVALGRLLLAHCDALLLDEPFASLDAALRRTLTRLVARIVAERSIPSVLVTHQLADAQAFADRIAVIDQGQVLQQGAPDEVVLRPSSRRAAELVGYLGFVPAPAGERGPSAVAGVHPDRVIPAAQPERGLVVTAEVTALRPSGAGWEADALADGAAFTCRLPDRPAGTRLSVTILDPPYFGPDGAALVGALSLTGTQRAEPGPGETGRG
jgi:ABC-type sulfate/molybdate transport systems ATPase subunit